MKVHLLWHIAHHNEAGEDGATLHLDGDVPYLDEQDGDDAKLLGVYSTEALAEERIHRARLLPGFAEEPDCFHIGEYTLDRDEWTEGFVRLAAAGTEPAGTEPPGSEPPGSGGTGPGSPG
ncbi:hypothetical protein [Kitasatospora sp. NPDC093679]|uniref:DUF7336 domain-containing protein n=1 Tax=Kitasatospora sp. NPDC093679 TaxID=3154983 RepID=UPI00343F0832